MKVLFQILSLWATLSHNHHHGIRSFCAEAQVIPEVTQAEPALEIFSAGIEAAGLTGLLSTEGPFTVFGPDNAAFTTLDPKYFDPEWEAHLTEIMLQHVVEGPPFYSQNWEVGIDLVPLSGGDLTVTQVTPTLQLNNNITVVTPDILAENGVIHIIDTVILPPSARDSIMDIIGVIPDFFSTLESLLVQTGLDETLRSDGPFTMFAPSNDAFSALNPDQLANLQADPDALMQLLEYHIAPGIYLVETLNQDNVTTVPTLQGTPLPKPLDSVQFVDLLATNGAMHIVNEVLLPPGGFVTGAPGSTTAPGGTPIQPDTTTPATPMPTLAPIGTYDDFDWSELPDDVRAAAETLGYDENSWNNGLAVFTEDLWWDDLTPEQQEAAMVFGYDREAWNGPNGPTGPPTEAPGTEADGTEPPVATQPPAIPDAPDGETQTPTGTIADIAIASNFTVFLSALNMSGWLEPLQEPGNAYTVFGVPNDGFDNLPTKFIEDPIWNSHLTNVITYHIIPGLVPSVNLTENSTIDTLNFNTIEVTSGNPLQINGINVTETDIEAVNGLIHVVDEVLLPPSATDTALDLLAGFEQFSIFNSLINSTGLNELFDGTGPITTFAPVDEAFNALPVGALEALADDPDALRNILLYHVAPDMVEFLSLGIDETVNVTTEQSSNVTFRYDGDTPRINDAQVLFSDLLVQNGLVQVIDAVLIPPTGEPTEAPTAMTTSSPTVMASEPATTTSPSGAQTAMATSSPTAMASEVAATTSPTVGAATTTTPTSMPTGGEQTSSPTEDAMELTAAPTEMATETEAPDTTAPTTSMPPLIPITDAPTATTMPPVDLTAGPTEAATTMPTAPPVAGTAAPTSPPVAGTTAPTSPPVAGTATPTERPLETTAAPTEMDTTMPPADSTLMDAIRNDPDLATLNELIILANLEEALEGAGPFTMFAPNNDAFDALPEETMDSLSATPGALENFLLYHVVAPDVLLSSQLEDGKQYPTAQGESVTISIDDEDTIMVNEATVLVPDVRVSNGVLHVIDAVLSPSAPDTVPPTPAQQTQAPTRTPTDVPVVPPTTVPTNAPTVPPIPADTDAPIAPPIETPAAQPTAFPAVTVAPSDCVTVPGQQVCCPPGETTGIFFFCRYL